MPRAMWCMIGFHDEHDLEDVLAVDPALSTKLTDELVESAADRRR